LCVIGGGTNTFFGEQLDNLLVMKMMMKGVEKKQVESNNRDVSLDEVRITAMAGETWDDVVKYTVEHDLWGIENLSLIPGTAGAAPVQNIGAYGVEIADTLHSLRAYDTSSDEFVTLTKDECCFGYRDSIFKQQKGVYIVVSVTLSLSVTSKPVFSYKPLDTLKALKEISPLHVRTLVIQTRIAKLPDYREYPNAGSFFKNPVMTSKEAERLCASYLDVPLISQGDMVKIPAAWLIEHVAKMKGVRVGDVGTWPHQPLVLVNYGNAQASDLDTFAESIERLVFERSGIHLEREVEKVLVD
jgi:UDP-N-acetylmuramate dehydrogenase